MALWRLEPAGTGRLEGDAVALSCPPLWVGRAWNGVLWCVRVRRSLPIDRREVRRTVVRLAPASAPVRERCLGWAFYAPWDRSEPGAEWEDGPVVGRWIAWLYPEGRLIGPKEVVEEWGEVMRRSLVHGLATALVSLHLTAGYRAHLGYDGEWARVRVAGNYARTGRLVYEIAVPLERGRPILVDFPEDLSRARPHEERMVVRWLASLLSLGSHYGPEPYLLVRHFLAQLPEAPQVPYLRPVPTS